MNATTNQIVLGIGSHHGDDAIGWHVIDRLAALGIDDLTLRKSLNPLDLLDFLDSSNAVHIVDAAIGMEASEYVKRLDYADPVDRALIRKVPTIGSHDATLSFALSVADSLEKRTNHITLWLGNGKRFEPYSELSAIGRKSIQCCFNALSMELCDARIFTR